MKKRIVSLLLTVAMIVSVCCVFASAMAPAPAPAPAPSYRYYYYYDKATADVDVVSDGLCCKSESGKTLTAYVDSDTEKAVIDVDTTSQCYVKVTVDGKTVSKINGEYVVSLAEGWNTFKVTVTSNYNPALYWAKYFSPAVTKPVEPPKTVVQPKEEPKGEPKPGPEPMPETKPEPEKAPPKDEPQKPVYPAYYKWYPMFRPTDLTNTYYVKIYRGDLGACGHVPCLYEGCGKHACTIHGSYDLGTVSADTYKITAITNQGGGVSSADAKFTDNKVVSYLTVEVVNGAGAEINIVPQTGYTINKITVDGVSVPLTLKYTFSEVTADHSIAVEFAPVK